jgi:hypothetical protein
MSAELAGPTARSGKALVSLALALLSLALWPLLGGVALALAGLGLALGGLALWDIQRSPGRLRGRALALWGITLQVAGGMVFLVLPPAVQRVREAAQRSTSA